MTPGCITPKSGSRSLLSLFCFKNKKGFTFLELLLVLVIFGAVLALTYPSLQGWYQKARVETAVRELTKILEFARSEAFRREGFIRWKCDLRENAYFLEILKSPDDSDPTHFEGFRGKGSWKLPEEMKIEAGSASEILFRPDGGSAEYKIVLSAESGERMTVQSKTYFGKPEIHFS